MPLPKWLTRNKAGAFIVDADAAYPMVFSVMGVSKIDQYALETAYQCLKLKVQDIAETFDDDPRKKGGVLAICFQSKDKTRWSFESHPEGKGWFAATKGREARNVTYPQIKDKLG